MDSIEQDIDDWPLQEFNPGPFKHLHAIGVISLTFARLENSLERLFFSKVDRTGGDNIITRASFYRLNEKKRISLIRKTFSSEHERNQDLVLLAQNLIDCSEWARNCRNQILHSEMHPISFYHNQDLLYLEKRLNKVDEKSVYIDLSLTQIREIAEKTWGYVKRSARLNLYFRYAYLSFDDVPAKYRQYTELPDTLLDVEPQIKFRDFPQPHE